MSLPGSVRRSVEARLEDLGRPARILSATSVPGGCVNHGLAVATSVGETLFLKWNGNAPPGMFAREAEGLAALGAVGVLRVPRPIASGGDAETTSWLLMEHIEPGRASPASDRRLGAGLAALHAADGGPSFGWDDDNWIGPLPQANGRTGSWGEFWRSRRLLPQLLRAREAGLLDDPLFDRVAELVPRALADVTVPSLLHGDLWSGNVFTSHEGEPVVFDPAVYAGDAEVDLAMSELFGGFGSAFYEEYAAVRGISPEYRAYRRDVYQLYYLLVHVNLFGGSYASSSRRAAERVLAELG